MKIHYKNNNIFYIFIWKYNMNKKLYPTDWKAVVTIINNVETLLTFHNQPGVNLNTFMITCINNIPWTLLYDKNGVGKDTIKWLKSQMKAFEKRLNLDSQIIRNDTFFTIVDCVKNTNWAIKEIDKSL